MKPYPIQLEIAGPGALWARPDTLPDPVSYAAAAFRAVKGVFQRRLERGRWFYAPCLGWKEFVPDHAGPFRGGTAPCASENDVIPAFLEMCFTIHAN